MTTKFNEKYANVCKEKLQKLTNEEKLIKKFKKELQRLVETHLTDKEKQIYLSHLLGKDQPGLIGVSKKLEKLVRKDSAIQKIMKDYIEKFTGD